MYEARLAELKSKSTSLAERDGRLSSLRGITFLATVGLGLYGLFASSALVWLLAGLAAATFAVFVVMHAIVSTEQFEVQRRVKLAEQGLQRVAGTYRAPTGEEHRRGDVWVDGEHPYTSDLDVFGAASVFEQLNVTQTPGGAATLATWLRRAATNDVIEQRQRAVRELAELDELREEMALAGMRAGKIDRDASAFLKWAKETPHFVDGGGAMFSAIAILLVLLSFGLLAVSSMFGELWTKIWIGSVAVNIVYLTLMRPRVEPVLGPVCIKQSPLGHYRELLAAAESATFKDTSLVALQDSLKQGDTSASATMTQLESLNGLAAARHNAFVHILADIFLLWDVWCAYLVDRWRKANGKRVASWIDTLSELEALVSLATFARERDTYAWPEFTDDGPRYEAKELGHPLIPVSERVNNDVALTPKTSALMITGSNMSGKSTMLRSIGVNAVLAHAGAPVCAKSMRLSNMRVYTSMRVGDDLDRGASRFFMEVHKLDTIVKAVDEGEATMCFLLDEVLHGTNSRERNIGAKAVVRYLIDKGALGAVSSHDLGLVELDTLTDGRMVNVHFEDHIENDEMCFDYRMKKGPVSTSNALRLMRTVGINVPGLEDA